MRFFLNNKSGFICRDKIVTINDINGNFFYFKENPQSFLHFNLPVGEYTTNNKLEKTDFRVYNKKHLPKPNSVKKLPSGFNIFFTENPNKCSVDTHSDPCNIYFDNSFKGLPEYFLTYVKTHELGHFFYSGQGNKSEKYCDGFAYNQMLKEGYNPSQIYHAQKVILSNRPEAVERKKFIYKAAKKSF